MDGTREERRRGGEGRDATEQGILGGRRVDNGEQGGEGAPAAEVGLEPGGLAATIPPVRKTTTSMAMIDSGGGGWCFTPSMSFSVCRRCRDGDSKSVTVSESHDRAPQSILEPPLRITMEGGREDFGDDGDGAGNRGEGFRSGTRMVTVSREEILDGLTMVRRARVKGAEQCSGRRSQVGGVGEESTGGRHQASEQGILGTGEMSVGSSELGSLNWGVDGRQEESGERGGGGWRRGGEGRE